MKTLIALVLLSAVASANVGNGAQYLTKSHGIVTVTTTVHHTTNTALVTYSDSAGTSLTVGGTPGGGNSVSSAGEGTTHGTDPEGNPTTGGTYRVNKHGELQGKNAKGKWRKLKEAPEKKEGDEIGTVVADSGGGSSGGVGTVPSTKAEL